MITGWLPQTRFDGQIRDLFAGFRWLSEHLNDHPIQKDAVFLTGDSAGALLAVYAALIEQSSRLQRQFQVEPSGLPLLGLGLSFGMYFTRHRILQGSSSPCFLEKTTAAVTFIRLWSQSGSLSWKFCRPAIWSPAMIAH